MIPHTILYFVSIFWVFFLNPLSRTRPRPDVDDHERETFLSKRKCVRISIKCPHQIVRMVLGKAFKPGSNDSEYPKTVFYGYEVTKFVVYIFSLIVLEMFLVLAIIFWDKFLFKVSYGCPYNFDVPNLICYNSTSGDPINCSNSEELHNDQSIECYRLILDWSSAAGATGGTYVLLSFGITFIPRMLLKIKNGVTGIIQKICVYYLLIISIMVIEIVVFCVYFAFLLGGNHSLGVYLAAYGVILILLTVLVIPLMKFKKTDYLNNEVHVDRNARINGSNYESTSPFT